MVTDVSGQHVGPIFKSPAKLLLKTGSIGCPETSVTTDQRCVTSHKSKDLNVWRSLSVAKEKVISLFMVYLTVLSKVRFILYGRKLQLLNTVFV